MVKVKLIVSAFICMFSCPGCISLIYSTCTTFILFKRMIFQEFIIAKRWFSIFICNLVNFQDVVMHQPAKEERINYRWHDIISRTSFYSHFYKKVANLQFIVFWAKMMNDIVLGIILNYLIFIIKFWTGSVYTWIKNNKSVKYVPNTFLFYYFNLLFYGHYCPLLTFLTADLDLNPVTSFLVVSYTAMTFAPYCTI